jgi:hypothetical protein
MERTGLTIGYRQVSTTITRARSGPPSARAMRGHEFHDPRSRHCPGIARAYAMTGAR